MSFSPVTRGLLLLGGLIAIATIMFRACASDLSGPSATDEEAREIYALVVARAALIRLADLPAGWTESSSGGSSGRSGRTDPLCDRLNTVRDEAAADKLADASSRFEKDTPTTLPLQATNTVTIYGTEAPLLVHVEKERALLTEGSLTACLETYVRALYGSRLISVNVHPPLLGVAPSGALSYGFDAEITIPSQNPQLPTSPPLTVHTEYYLWPIMTVSGFNATSFVVASGPRDYLTADLVSTLLQKAQEAWTVRPAPVSTKTPPPVATVVR